MKGRAHPDFYVALINPFGRILGLSNIALFFLTGLDRIIFIRENYTRKSIFEYLKISRLFSLMLILKLYRGKKSIYYIKLNI